MRATRKAPRDDNRESRLRAKRPMTANFNFTPFLWTMRSAGGERAHFSTITPHRRATNEPNNAIMGNDTAHRDMEPGEDFCSSLRTRFFLRIGRL
jgi:hypothetical protein